MAGKNAMDLNNELNSYEDDNDDSIDNMYLTFELGKEVYGIGIGYVTEIVGIQNVTEVPDMPDYVKGVVNLRGQVIPVLDVRIRFHMPEREYDERTCIVVVNINNVKLGLVVDTVSEVMTINDSQISAAPKIAAGKSGRYIKGMGKIGDEVKILLDVQKLLFEEELEALQTEK